MAGPGDTAAFLARFELAPTAAGPLDGLAFAAKDLFDVAGHPTTCGNPRWAETHPVPTSHAVAVQLLLSAGARLVGKTVTDELAFSIVGENAHFGTPLNPAAPERVPGGSSSGSASAVARGECDLALGTDTTGSVRVPAAYCGIYGMRPTHGRVSVAGVMPFAPGFDTVGVLARDPALLERAMGVLLGAARSPSQETPTLALLDEAWELCDEAVREACRAFVAERGLVGASLSLHDVAGELAPEAATWFETHCALQWAEIAASLGGWLASARPRFGDLIARNFALLERVDAAALPAVVRRRAGLARALAATLSTGRLLCFPTTATPAPRKGTVAKDRSADDGQRRTLTLQTFASIGRLPQVTVPAGVVDGAPVGLSFAAAPGHDERLLRFVTSVTAPRSR